jgi:hypothetical protein
MESSQIINVDKYPIHELDSQPARALIESVRKQLKYDGSCTLDGFVNAAVVQKMAQQAGSLSELGYPGPTAVSPYFFNYQIAEGLDLDDDHPTKRKGRRNLRQVATDLIPEDHLLSQLHRSSLMTGFLSKVLQKPVYRYTDRFQSLNISVMDEGGCQQWHFDGGDMVTTLLLQAPERGGVFEYVPNIRSKQEENFDRVRRVLDGHSDQVKQLNIKAGTLSLFQGHYSMHRVTEVEGSRRRLQAILGYTSDPDLQGNRASSILHYGPRVAELLDI